MYSRSSPNRPLPVPLGTRVSTFLRTVGSPTPPTDGRSVGAHCFRMDYQTVYANPRFFFL